MGIVYKFNELTNTPYPSVLSLPHSKSYGVKDKKNGYEPLVNYFNMVVYKKSSTFN